MSIDRDDPKWTAYVLGELDSAALAALELELESSDEAREFVQELKLAASFMKEGLTAHADAALTPAQRTSIQIASASREAKPWFGRTIAWAGGLAAAALVIATISVPSLLRSRQGVSEMPLTRDSLNSPAAVAPQQATNAFGVPSKQDAAAASVPVQVRDAKSKDSRGAPVNESQQKNQPLTQIAQGDFERRQVLAQDSVARVQSEAAAAPSTAASVSTADGLKEALKKVESGNAIAMAAPPPPVSAVPGVAGRGGAQGQQGQQGQQASAQGLVAGGGGGVARTGVLGGFLRAREETQPAAAPVDERLGLADRSAAPGGFNQYNPVTDNSFISARQQQVATFSVDVDTASYANVRRFLNQNQMPPRDAVRIEELVNYFSYEYPQASGQPVTPSLEVAAAPWNPQHRLVRVGVKAKDVRLSQKSSNLVFLIDVSGSMGTAERLPLLKSGLHLLVDRLTESDKVSIVTYAGASGIALQPISGDRKSSILQVIDNLHAEGSTNGGAGIQTAYELAVSNFIPGSVNRVILATDGDFNVGITNPNDLTRLIEDRARSGVFLTVLGFGNNFKDSLLGRLAEKGHGNYAFIDTLNEARKVLVEQIDSTLVAVAKDVKVQLEFNPAQVNAYRLLGYENRLMAAQDFNNDLKQANDMGSGQTVTALFEVVPNGVDVNATGVEPLRYQSPAALAGQPRNARGSGEMLDLRINYKDPDGSASKLLEVPFVDRGTGFSNASTDFRFAAAVAGFGLVLRDSPYKGSATLDWVLATAQSSRGADKNGYRDEFVRLVQRAIQIRR